MASLEKIGKYKIAYFSNNEWEDKEKNLTFFQHRTNFFYYFLKTRYKNISLFFQKTFTQIPLKNTFTIPDPSEVRFPVRVYPLIFLNLYSNHYLLFLPVHI